MSAPQDKLTPRQLTALVSVYFGDGVRTNRIYRGHGSPALYGPDDQIPEWGKTGMYGRGSSMGGAISRMVTALEDLDVFPLKVSERTGHAWYQTDRLTVKGLQLLKARYPALPDIDARIAEREAEEAAERVAAEEKRRANRAELNRRAEARKAERRERMAAVLQDYQVPHQLTPDQLEAMWLRIAGEEVEL